MEVKYKSANGQFEVNFDCKDQQTLFEELSAFQEVFETPETVKIAGKDVPLKHISFSVRTVDGNSFYEKRYVGPDKDLWGYKFAYGSSQNKKGHLFPKFTVKEENRADYESGGGGWFRYKGKQQEAPATSGSEKPAF